MDRRRTLNIFYYDEPRQSGERVTEQFIPTSRAYPPVVDLVEITVKLCRERILQDLNVSVQ
ncbi:hypothetical protein KIN20_030041 [Parelaphostrongylus tenuis]|uniref:Uncharacterized protein n=1 Tax=Parelaphostrongylus tenuis TaxID=148309 RepID=A0AAD5WG25_PARTN|nr:hypothetical protein KIN20_030041 [Parelaphostrongylus tenuis]